MILEEQRKLSVKMLSIKEEVKKPGLKFNLKLALIDLRTTGPRLSNR